LTTAARLCESRGVLNRTHLLRLVVVGILTGAPAIAGCATGSGDRVRSAGEDPQAAQNEANATKALRYAKNTDTIPAYQDIIKRYPGTEAAGQAQLEIARLQEVMARQALGNRDLKAARQFAMEARKNGDTTIGQLADADLAQIDRAEAREVGKIVEQTLSKAPNLEGCTAAMAATADVLGEQPSDLLVREVREKTLQQLSGCVDRAVRAASEDGSYAAVRKALDDPKAKKALGDKTWFAFVTMLNEAVVAAMRTAVQADIDARKWETAFETIKKWGADGRAAQPQVELALQAARDTITKDLLARGQAELGGRNPAPVIADIDRALKLFEGLNVAEELTTLRRRLTVWSECKRIACTAVTRPTPGWNFGATKLMPADAPSAAAIETFANGTRFWVLARGRGLALISKQEPASVGSWADRIAAASGWVDASTIKAEDTTQWLPVGQALVDVRVWLPTGRADKLYLLGVVKAVQGDKVTVQKISDGESVTVKRTDLRIGTLTPGAKVLAFCRDELTPVEARLDALVEHRGGTPTARVMCLTDDGKDDKTRDEVLGSLRARPEWLPARKP
jgi:hypothetical protein